MEEKKVKENSLDDLGVIFLSGNIDGGKAEGVCRSIIEMNLSGKHQQIQLIINSAGGECAAGFAIIDMMQWSRLPVYTTGLGMVASMGLLVFMVGKKGSRVITPRTSILSHRFWSLNIGNHSQLLARRKEEDLVHQRIVNHYLEYTGVGSVEELESTLLRDVDTWLSAEETVKYGIADLIEGEKRNEPTAVWS